ncbi:unnamed protein product [Rotaria sp. Silwood2]|nr:unnamed protein product [Rotaria sp. Silwood2]CAF3180133.1 unnamed protein product [Rotaria sp. Silwood2]CAF4033645.1 unnamed protein product [Rotaria sp. Silwood2]
MVESNSPAMAGGLRMRDFILAINGKNVTDVHEKIIRKLINRARDSKSMVELLVCQEDIYENTRCKSKLNDLSRATRFETPTTMPIEYIEFSKNRLRTCTIVLNADQNSSFGIETARGQKGIGLYIIYVVPNSPAALAGLRNSDRIVKINGENIDKDKSESIRKKIKSARIINGAIELYVADTHAYKTYKDSTSEDKTSSGILSRIAERCRRRSSTSKTLNTNQNGLLTYFKF